MMVEGKCFLINTTLEDLGVKQEDVPARMMFNPDEVCFMRECLDDDGNVNPKECVIHFRMGLSVVLNYSYDEIKDILNQKTNETKNRVSPGVDPGA